MEATSPSGAPPPLPRDVELLHQPVRLRLMALLHARGDVGASAARQALDVTAGNLDAHAQRLAGSGLVAVRKELLRGGFEARYRITPAGRAAFEAYLAWLDAFVDQARAADGAGGPRAVRTPE